MSTIINAAYISGFAVIGVAFVWKIVSYFRKDGDDED